jgi:hypothetical protein
MVEYFLSEKVWDIVGGNMCVCVCVCVCARARARLCMVRDNAFQVLIDAKCICIQL